jgi:hypothetical protein
MSAHVVGTYTIGQTPRPDLAEELTGRLPSVRFEIAGALDGLERADIPPCPRGGYPLETRLRDGTRIVVDAAFVEPLLETRVGDLDRLVSAHLILCAGPFPGLAASARRSASRGSAKALVLPFEAAARELSTRRLHRLDVVVPFDGQAAPAADKWGGAGFACRVHSLTDRPGHRSVAEWISGLVARARAQAVVFDYVGFPADFLDEIATEVDLPVFDLGRLALDELEVTLDKLRGP